MLKQFWSVVKSVAFWSLAIPCIIVGILPMVVAISFKSLYDAVKSLATEEEPIKMLFEMSVGISFFISVACTLILFGVAIVALIEKTFFT
jgi:hypothetical protein